MTVATYCYYEKVHRTKHTAIVSNLLHRNYEAWGSKKKKYTKIGGDFSYDKY